jgi:hypothetical protein
VEKLMSNFSTFIGPLIGMLGVIFGSILNEFLRRANRVEEYSSPIFAKRLEAYEVLMSLISDGSKKADEAINSPDLTPEERHNLISSAVLSITGHIDRNTFYIDEELGAHCVALFMGTEDIHDAAETQKQHLLDQYYKRKKDAYRMIKEDSGVMQINKLFRSINRPRITGTVVEAIRELRRGQRKTQRSTRLASD